MKLSGNAALANLNGLANLTSIAGSLEISGLPSLTNLDDLARLTSVGGVVDLWFNNALVHLDGLAALTSIGGFLRINRNPALTSLAGLAYLTAIGGSVTIENNDALTSLDGLNGLTSIESDLWIRANDALITLRGLNRLSALRGRLLIENNAALTNLDALAELTSIGGYLSIEDNSTLAACHCGLAGLLDSGGVAGSSIIQNNAAGCNSVDEILAQGTEGCPAGTALTDAAALPTTFALHANYPNPFNPATTIAFDVPRPGRVTLTVYDVLGRAVAVLAAGLYPAGRHEAVWAAERLPSGLYVYRLETAERTLTRTMLLLK